MGVIPSLRAAEEIWVGKLFPMVVAWEPHSNTILGRRDINRYGSLEYLVYRLKLLSIGGPIWGFPQIVGPKIESNIL